VGLSKACVAWFSSIQQHARGRRKGGVFFVSSVQLQYKGIEEGDVFWLLYLQEAVLCQSSVIFIRRFGSLLVT
jgi:hypothetical protein